MQAGTAARAPVGIRSAAGLQRRAAAADLPRGKRPRGGPGSKGGLGLGGRVRVQRGAGGTDLAHGGHRYGVVGGPELGKRLGQQHGACRVVPAQWGDEQGVARRDQPHVAAAAVGFDGRRGAVAGQCGDRGADAQQRVSGQLGVVGEEPGRDTRSRSRPMPLRSRPCWSSTALS